MPLTLEHLKLRRPLYDAGGRVKDVWFPVDAIVSVVTVMHDGTQLEAFTIGREGVTAAQSVFDGPVASRQTYVQVQGDAYRLPFVAFIGAVERYPEFGRLVQRYVSAQIDVIAQQNACNRLHYVAERCARWILLTHDRVGRDEFPLTHEVLATMLGVRRAGVSIAAAQLQHEGAIRYARGRFTIVDRGHLEAAACECYAVIRDAYARRRTP